MGFVSTGPPPVGSITNATCESYFKDPKHSFHTKKECRPDFIQNHADVVINLIDRALTLGSKNVRNQDFKPNLKETVAAETMPVKNKKSFEYSTAKWKSGSTNRSKKSYQDRIKLETTKLSESIKPRPATGEELPKFEKTKYENETPEFVCLSSDSEDHNSVDLPDQLNILDKIWVTDTEELVVFNEGQFGISGVESELLSLRFDTCVSSAVAMPYANQIMEARVQEYLSQRSIKLVSSEVIYHISRNEFQVSLPIFKENPSLLPSEKEFDIINGKLYTILFFKQHSFLVELKFENKSINYFDSLEGYIDKQEMNQMFNSFKNLLFNKYSLRNWKVFNRGSVQQFHNDCVVISLMNLEIRLQNLDHLKNVDRNNARQFRYQMVADLMKTTPIGRTFFDKCGHAAEVIKQIQKRQAVRNEISTMLTTRSKISNIKKKLVLFEGVKPQVKFAVNMDQESKTLETRDVAKYDSKYSKLKIMNNTFILSNTDSNLQFQSINIRA
ncbi:hypothetical protein Fcan01_11243 [Folsomia candida]|uniref:Uncharacterized protein n=1 Tax=Folsomia candida TaxID=158441 RepID=A0A226ED03_FOLCA|nr:hypothetical protein Fcan01_11243 [Folsomia candida]